LHMVQLMPLPLTVSCFSKIQIGFYLSGTGQRAVKRVCVCVCVCQVYERPEWSSPTPLLRACGNSTPPIVVSSTNQMYVRMRADGTLARRGFNATYTTGNAAARKQ